MNKRKTALEIIRIEVAKHGDLTNEALRAYASNKISSEAFKDAFNKGMKQRREKKNA